MTTTASQSSTPTTPLADLGAAAGTLEGLIRVDDHPMDELLPRLQHAQKSEYPHEQIFGSFCPVQGFVDAPPRELYEWLADSRSLEEWTYSIRGMRRTDQPDLWVGDDALAPDTRIYVRTEASPESMTVDYHCAWDQGEHLWMIYLMRVVDAQVVLNRPGSVVLWNNCRHPFYRDNPFAELAPESRPFWVGDLWDAFGPGHEMELNNLRTIAEYRRANGLPLKPDWMQG